MKLINLNKELTSRSLLNVLACAAGYSLWYLFSQSTVITVSLPFHVYVYNTQEQESLQAPPLVTITMQGRRSDIHYYITHHCDIHLDRESLNVGKNLVVLTENNLFLPPTLKLLHYSPLLVPIIISLKQDLP